jgi:hypothetical protein
LKINSSEKGKVCTEKRESILEAEAHPNNMFVFSLCIKES